MSSTNTTTNTSSTDYNTDTNTELAPTVSNTVGYARPLADNAVCATRAVMIEEVPDIEANLRRAPVLDAKGKGTAAVLEDLSGESDDELPGLVDVEGSSDEDEDGDAQSEDLVRILTDIARQ